jgi:peptidoglycan/xylan/chitin deacetylase (PgdA/CDA1 family)
MGWVLFGAAAAIAALAHMLPVPFLLDAAAGARSVWHMPRRDPPTIYLTFDDGPNPSTTPALLDLLARENVRATFFLIDRHITDETIPLVRRIFAEGHAVGIHSHTRRYMLMSPAAFARTIDAAARRLEQFGGRPCRAFRPHAGWRSAMMYAGLARLDYVLVGWGWMLWDFNWYQRRTGQATASRVLSRISSGDIVVMHDGDESAPDAPQPQTIDASELLIPALRGRGFTFGTICGS